MVLPTDVAHHDQIEAAAEAVENQFGPIGLWINDAMVSMYAPFWKIGPDEYKHITDVTYHGQVYGTMAALKRMRPRGYGTIVQVGSALAHRSIPLQSAYCGAKHAIAGFTESIRSELIHEKSKIKITTVLLPGVNTTQFMWTKNRMPHKPQPAGTIFQPEVAADAIVYAAHHQSASDMCLVIQRGKQSSARNSSRHARPLHRKTGWEGAQRPIRRIRTKKTISGIRFPAIMVHTVRSTTKRGIAAHNSGVKESQHARPCRRRNGRGAGGGMVDEQASQSVSDFTVLSQLRSMPGKQARHV